jgi:hypothetical protein
LRIAWGADAIWTMLAVQGPYIQSRVAPCGCHVLGVDHAQVADLLRYVAARYRVALRLYGATHVPSVGVAYPAHGVIAIDEETADCLRMCSGETALLFPIFHEAGHVRFAEWTGRQGERVADMFASAVLVQLGWTPAEVVRGAAVTLTGTPDDGVHDAGWARLEWIADVATATAAHASMWVQ